MDARNTTVEATLSIRGLGIALHGKVSLARDVSMDLAPGRILALVGESGSGKTMIGRSILRLLPEGIAQDAGEIRYRGTRLDTLTDRQMQALRGSRIGMIFQEPLVSLNPAIRIGAQMAEGLQLHRSLERAEIRRLSIEMLRRIRLADPERALDAYPHEFSGGMRQRIMLASVMLLQPDVLIADEPTTALDTLSQQEVLETMVSLTREAGSAVMLITHDLGVVARYADEVVVLRQGEVVERGSTEAVIRDPQHPYTRELLSAVPRRSDVPPPARTGRTVLEARDLRLTFPLRGSAFGRTERKAALDGVSLSVRQGETVAVVGASGSGKTTLGRAMLRLQDVESGSLTFFGEEVVQAPDTALGPFRRACQIVFQDPFSSLDPRMRVGALVAEALRCEPALGADERRARVAAALAEVGLPGLMERLPHQLSGGQRQRVAIARAIVRRPELVVADEPVSALDMTVQRQILELFLRLQREHGFACVFISHNLAAVQRISHRIVVMESGRIVEEGPTAEVLVHSRHPFTRRLIDASPAL